MAGATYPNDKSLRVSHETIYKSLFIQTRGIFRKELREHLRTNRKFRHAKPHSPLARGHIVDGVSISERPCLTPISVTIRVLGSVAPTKTPMVYCRNISLSEAASLASRSRT